MFSVTHSDREEFIASSCKNTAPIKEDTSIMADPPLVSGSRCFTSKLKGPLEPLRGNWTTNAFSITEFCWRTLGSKWYLFHVSFTFIVLPEFFKTSASSSVSFKTDWSPGTKCIFLAFVLSNCPSKSKPTRTNSPLPQKGIMPLTDNWSLVTVPFTVTLKDFPINKTSSVSFSVLSNEIPQRKFLRRKFSFSKNMLA